LATCQYESGSFEYIPPEIPLDCKEEPIKNGEFCIFHDKNHYTEHEQEAAKKFEEKVKESISQNEPLICFGYFLPAIDFRRLLEGKSFAKPVYFNKATFYRKANFIGAKFSEEAYFAEATFSKGAYFLRATFSKGAYFLRATFSKGAYFAGAKFSEGAADFSRATFSEGAADFLKATFSKRAYFNRAKFLASASFLKSEFKDETFFRYTIFEQSNKVTFDDNNLKNVSFANSDITRIRFGDNVEWGGKDQITIIEEEWLKRRAQEKNDDEYKGGAYKNVSLELVLSVYRNLRENYEFRLRYDYAGKFFIKEEELKRNYRQVYSQFDLRLIALHGKLRLKWDKSPLPKAGKIIQNDWFRRHFSLTGIYYHLSRYGESISRPTAIGAITVFLSTLFWVTQGNPILEPHFDPTQTTNSTYSTFVGFEKAGDATQWLEGFERSLAGFLPFLSAGGETQVGIFDYIIKIFGGGLTFVLLAIALRRKFERKYTR
jgi:Pentapeptide repeats (9 copies)